MRWIGLPLFLLALTAYAGSGGNPQKDCDHPAAGKALDESRTPLCAAVRSAQEAKKAAMPAPVDPDAAKLRFERLGFSCEAPSATRGLVCQCDPKRCPSFGDYPEPVGIVVPPGYRPTEKPELVLHLHGNNDSRNLKAMLNDFKLPEGLAKSGRNAILVVPLSHGRQGNPAVASTAKLAKADHFKGFIDEVSSVAKSTGLLTVKASDPTPEPGSIAITTHSGGCYPAAEIIKNGIYADKINELYLIDSMYTPTPDTFKVWAANPEHRFWSSYTDHNYAGKNELVKAVIDQPEGTCAKGDWGADRAFPSACLVATTRCGFLHVGPDGALHNAQVPDVFQRFLTPAN